MIIGQPDWTFKPFSCCYVIDAYICIYLSMKLTRKSSPKIKSKQCLFTRQTISALCIRKYTVYLVKYARYTHKTTSLEQCVILQKGHGISQTLSRFWLVLKQIMEQPLVNAFCYSYPAISISIAALTEWSSSGRQTCLAVILSCPSIFSQVAPSQFLSVMLCQHYL